MLHWIKWIVLSCLALMALTALLVWLVLSSSLMAGVRGHLVETLLARKLGNAVQIDGGVWVEPGKELHIIAEKLILHSPSMPKTNLAGIEHLAFRLPVADLLQGRVEVHDISIKGADVMLIAQKDGTVSWAPASDGKADNPKVDRGIIKFLDSHQIAFADSSVTYQDARNGLDMNFQLETLDLGRAGEAGASSIGVQGKGALNGQDVTLSGSFPNGQPFSFKSTFSHAEIVLQGTPDAGGFDKGYTADMTATIADLNQVLAIFKLAGTTNGTGKITASITATPDGRSAKGDVKFALVGGESLTVSADIKDLTKPKDATVLTKLRLYPQGAEPPATRTRRNLKLVGIDMDLTSRVGQQPLRSMVITTNGFVLDTGGVGPPPISVGQISRTADGKLRIGKAEVRIGPPESPFLVLAGMVGNLLELEGFDFVGTVDAPADNLIAQEKLPNPEALGRITGSFDLKGDTKVLKLSALKSASKGTDLWNLDATGSVGNILGLDAVALDIVAEIPSVSAFLKALDLKPGDDIPAKLELKLNSQDTDWKSTARVSVAKSVVTSNLTLQAEQEHPMVRGTIESDLIRIAHLRDIIVASAQLGKLDKSQTAEPDPAKTTAQSAADEEKGSKAKGPFRNVTLQPIGQAILLSNMDVDIKIDLKKIEGDGGSGDIDSEFIVKDRKASLGPVKFAYGGGHFDLSAAMDMAKSPEVVSLKGSTGGWDFAHILDLLKFKKHASGILNASFEVSGKHASFKQYLETMSGYATVSMRNGSVDSQLLDLAGLGVVPWLFEKGRKKAAVIVCLRAPLSVSGGRFNLKNGVVETPKVQVVVQGDVNLNKDTLDISGQPRRIGKPLSRSPWPFTVVGPIKKPKVKVKDGPKRVRRADGASTMPARRKICVPDILQLK